MSQSDKFLVGIVVSFMSLSFMTLSINTQAHAVERADNGVALGSAQDIVSSGATSQAERSPVGSVASTIFESAPPGLESSLYAEESPEIAPPNTCRSDPQSTDSGVSRSSQKQSGKPGPIKIGEVVGLDLDSGRHAATESYAASMYSDVVSIEDSIWTILHFKDVVLGPDDFIELTSLEDGASERIRFHQVTEGEVYSAAFNGDVRVELYVGPGSSGSGFLIAEAAVGAQPGDAAQVLALCPGTGADDRMVTTDARVCAILDGPLTTDFIGTGWFIEGGKTQNLPCMLTAGHVIDGTGADRIWCDVPCPFKAPPPAIQYTISSVEGFENDGVNCSPKDWAVLLITGTPGRPFFTLTNGPVGATAQTGVRGHGADSDTAANNFCLQKDHDVGQRTGDVVFHDVDTEGGSSGSPILFPHFDPNAKGWAIHTGCNPGGLGGGYAACGTWIHYAPLRAEIQEECFSWLAIELVSLDAIASATAVTLSWETASEVDNEGFFVLRATDPDGEFRAISGFIPAAGGPAFGANYEFVDDMIDAGVTYSYLLEDIDTSGTSTSHGADACDFDADPDCEPLTVTTPGLSAAEFCAEHEIQSRSKKMKSKKGKRGRSDERACKDADWRDNEGRHPRDCAVAKGSFGNRICVALADAD